MNAASGLSDRSFGPRYLRAVTILTGRAAEKQRPTLDRSVRR